MTMLRITFIAAFALATAACAMQPLPAPQATMDNLQAVRAAAIAPASVGGFTLAPGMPAKADKSIGIRAMSVAAPDGSFSSYLRTTLITELKAGGKYDPNSAIVITGQLTASRIDAGMDRPNATLGANFTVTRDGTVVYNQPLEVRDEWAGTFLGDIAIPVAQDHYTGLYAKLVGKLLSDEAFRAAAKPR